MRNVFLFLMLLAALSFIFFLVFFRESYLYEGSIHLGIFSVAMYLLWKKDLKNTLASMGFPGTLNNTILYTLFGLGAIFLLLLALGAISLFTGFNDQERIAEKVDVLPLYILVLAIIFAPITEELFFRAFLVQRTGIIPSSFIFAILHIAYGSVLEVAGVFLVGVILAMVYRHSKSITPCMLIHFIYNLLSILMMRFLT